MALSKTFFISNRIEFMSKLSDNTVVFLFAGNLQPMSQDTDYKFLPDRNFYYLTGLNVVSSKLILQKINGVITEYLFVEEKDPMKERWHGKALSFDEISKITGIDINNIYKLEDYDEKLYSIISFELNLAYDSSSFSDASKAFIKKYPAAEDISEVLTKMRMIKKPEEIEAIKKAIGITEDSIDAMKEDLHVGVSELDVYTKLEYEMSKRGSLLPAFSTITAFGDNAFYLHHSEPEGPDGEIATLGGQLQIDVGARVDGYCADISRVFFMCKECELDTRKAELLELIRNLRKTCWENIKPGINFIELNRIIRMQCGEWLLQHGLLNEGFTEEDTRKYYWHNTGHHMGLDVHDTTIKNMAFAEGNVLAIEPGVYIPEWHMGFRIEDDVLVTANGCELLSSGNDSSELIFTN